MLVYSFYSNVLLQCAFNQLIKAAFWISSGIGKLIAKLRSSRPRRFFLMIGFSGGKK